MVGLALLLASDGSSMVDRSVLPVDGGFVAHEGRVIYIEVRSEEIIWTIYRLIARDWN